MRWHLRLCAVAPIPGLRINPMYPMARITTLLMLLVLTGGCGRSEDWVPKESSDKGFACIYGSQDSFGSDDYATQGDLPEQQFLAGGPVYIQYFYCTGGSDCVRAMEVDCSASVAAGVIEIEGHASYEYLENNDGCFDDEFCESARCSSDGLEAGSYTVQFGEVSAQLDIPSSIPAFCLENW